MALTAAEYQQSLLLMERSSPLSNWTSLVAFPLPGRFSIDLPIYAISLWKLTFMVLALNCQSAQNLFVILVIAVARVGEHIQRDVERVPQHSIGEAQLSALRQSRKNFRKIKHLIDELNDVFALVVLVSCLHDLMTCIALIATTLSTAVNQDNESEEEFFRKFDEQQANSALVYTQLATGILNSLCRATALLYCYSQASCFLE
jgi:hypothetical protein